MFRSQVCAARNDRLAQVSPSGTAELSEYLWNAERPLAVIEGGVVFYIRADNINRPVFVTNAAGVKVWSASYLPFGGVATSTGTPVNLRFPGQWFELESGLHQNWMRDYDPTTGRYLQADPLGLVDGAGVFGYARSNPLRWSDPLGLETIVVMWNPVGNGRSSFGHISVSINGISYSFSHGGMHIENSTAYDRRNQFRGGVGMTLALSDFEEAQLRACLLADQGTYWSAFNNCTDPLERCLNLLGYDIAGSTFPPYLALELINGGLVLPSGLLSK